MLRAVLSDWKLSQLSSSQSSKSESVALVPASHSGLRTVMYFLRCVAPMDSSLGQVSTAGERSRRGETGLSGEKKESAATFHSFDSPFTYAKFSSSSEDVEEMSSHHPLIMTMFLN